MESGNCKPSSGILGGSGGTPDGEPDGSEGGGKSGGGAISDDCISGGGGNSGGGNSGGGNSGGGAIPDDGLLDDSYDEPNKSGVGAFSDMLSVGGAGMALEDMLSERLEASCMLGTGTFGPCTFGSGCIS